MLAQEKELKEHPERNRVKTVTMTAEELYEKIMKNGGSYDIEGGILALKMAVDEEKKRKKKRKNNKKKQLKKGEKEYVYCNKEYIAIKKRSNRANESLAVFEFVSKKEAEDFFTGMNKFIENDGILQELKEMATEPLKRLESRCDDKYANDTCAVSACMFQDEFEKFILPILIHASIKY